MERVVAQRRPSRFFAEDVETGKWVDGDKAYLELTFTPGRAVEVTDSPAVRTQPHRQPPRS